MPIRLPPVTVETIKKTTHAVYDRLDQVASSGETLRVGEVTVPDVKPGRFYNIPVYLSPERKDGPKRGTLGLYRPGMSEIWVFANPMIAHRADVYETLAHEVVHAIDLQHGPQQGIHQVPLVVGDVRLYKMVRQDVELVMTNLKPEAFPKSLTDADQRARYVANYLYRSRPYRKLRADNPRLDKRHFFSIILGEVNRYGKQLRAGFDEDVAYHRELTERRAWTRTIFEEVVKHLEQEQCGVPEYIRMSGGWGSKCISYTLEHMSPSYERVSKNLSEEQKRRVLKDITRLVYDQYPEHIGKMARVRI